VRQYGALTGECTRIMQSAYQQGWRFTAVRADMPDTGRVDSTFVTSRLCALSYLFGTLMRYAHEVAAQLALLVERLPRRVPDSDAALGEVLDLAHNALTTSSGHTRGH
jgi:hypothetical protein